MRHQLANKSLSRPTAHRLLMLRNLVSSLLQHESIMTTVAKAKETQKQAEHVISWGKRGGKSNWDKANAYLLNPTATLRPLFSTFAERYANRPGGYTRLHRAGFRVGDHAPLAVLELVDSPHDLKFETAARTVGREMAVRAKEGEAGPEGWWTFRSRVEGGTEAEVVERLGEAVELHELTRKNIRKVLEFRKSEPVLLLDDGTASTPTPETISTEQTPEADETSPTAPLSPTTHFLNRCHHHYLRTLATLSLSITPVADPDRQIHQLERRLNPSDYRGPPQPVLIIPTVGRTPKAGERTDGWNLAAGVEPTPKVGGPIGKAKGSRGREGRRVVWTGTKKSEDELAA